MHKGPEFFLTGGARRGAVALRSAAALLVGMACAGLALAGPGQEAPRMDKMPGMAARDMAAPAPRAEMVRQEVARQDLRPFDEQRRMVQAQQQTQQAQQQAESYRRPGHLTADERMELRRQINEVGQDIYVNKRRR